MNFPACLLGPLFLLAAPARGAIALPDIFADHMVLQRDMPVPVWGTAAPGERITVAVGESQRSAVADGQGDWLVRLDPMKAGGPYTMTVAGRSSLVFHDILVGEVWIGSGQSNMVWPVGRSKDSEQEIAAADFPAIRIAYKPCKLITPTDCVFPENRWIPVRPGTIRDLSAESYFFARELHRELKVPVGMIVRAVGGTPAVNWLSRRAEAEPGGLDPAGFAVALLDEREWSKHFSVILEPIASYAIRGVIWDQGESGTGIPGVKSDPMRRLLIRTWRRVWGQGDFPFLFFQYPKAGGWNPQLPLPRNLEPYRPHEWGLVSLEHAAQSLALPNVWMGITLDLETGTHPLDKQSYAGRLAKLALAKTYGKKVPHFGPTYESMRSEGDKIRVAFTHTDGGLVFHGGSKIQGFVVAGEDMKFVWADAEIDGDSVLVRHDGIAQPIHVRYAWAHHPKWSNLFNKAGFPALPFRSDR